MTAAMLRRSIARCAGARPCARPFATIPRLLAGGDSGSGWSRPTGERGGDAFTKRERSAEDMYIKREQQEKLRALREKMVAERKHMDEQIDYIDELTQEEGGQGEQPEAVEGTGKKEDAN